jgi:hypothetical protein
VIIQLLTLKRCEQMETGSLINRRQAAGPFKRTSSISSYVLANPTAQKIDSLKTAGDTGGHMSTTLRIFVRCSCAHVRSHDAHTRHPLGSSEKFERSEDHQRLRGTQRRLVGKHNAQHQPRRRVQAYRKQCEIPFHSFCCWQPAGETISVWQEEPRACVRASVQAHAHTQAHTNPAPSAREQPRTAIPGSVYVCA